MHSFNCRFVDNICSSATAFKAEENEKDGEEEDREDQEYDDDKA